MNLAKEPLRKIAVLIHRGNLQLGEVPSARRSAVEVEIGLLIAEEAEAEEKAKKAKTKKGKTNASQE